MAAEIHQAKTARGLLAAAGQDGKELLLHGLDGAVAAPIDAADCGEIERLHAALDLLNPAANPRTARLLASGRTKLSRKLMEEAGEVAIAAVKKNNGAVVRESADVLYQLVLLWRVCGVTPNEVWAEMCDRARRYGLAEKLHKPARAQPTR